MGQSGRKTVIPVKGLVYGIAATIISAIVLVALLAFMIADGRVGEQQAWLAICVIIAISGTAGAICTAGLTKNNGLAVILNSGIYWLVLLCTGLLFFDGSVLRPWQPLLIIATISGLICATCMKKKKRKGYKKLRSR